MSRSTFAAILVVLLCLLVPACDQASLTSRPPAATVPVNPPETATPPSPTVTPTIHTWTPTATPLTLSPLAEDFPSCEIIATRTPPPGAPTREPSPLDSDATARYVDPHVEICASATTLRVGDFLAVVGLPVDIGLPYYTLVLRDSGAADFTALVRITYDGQVESLAADASQVLEFVSVEADMHHVRFILHARAPGVVEIAITATGEVHYGYPGPATWSGGRSDTLSIAVAE